MANKYILAIDKFKGCLTSMEVEQAAAEGISAVDADAEIVKIPVSDGGEGLLQAFSSVMNLNIVNIAVNDPIRRPIWAKYGISEDGKTAVIETALAIGLSLLAPSERNPLMLTSYGAGELIADAISRGCRELVIGIGGSGTCDGGEGMIKAISDKQLLDAFSACRVTVASDVTNPLYGMNGAAYVYAPQKGATPDDLPLLDEKLKAYAEKVRGITGRDEADTPGAGAAGGLGFAIISFSNAKILPGIDLLLERVDFEKIISGAKCIFTGEGKADKQTLMGKLPFGVLKYARRKSVPVVLIAGKVDDYAALISAGFAKVSPVTPEDMPLEEAVKPDVATENVKNKVSEIIETIRFI